MKEIKIEESNRKGDKSWGKKKALMIFVLIIVIIALLGSVLYIVYFDKPSDYIPHMMGASYPDVMSNRSVKMTFNTFNPVPNPTEITVILEAQETTERIEVSFSSEPTTLPYIMTVSGATNTSCTANFYYFNDGNLLQNGDYIIIEGLQPGTTYRPMMYHIPSSTFLAWTGTNYFSTPP